MENNFFLNARNPTWLTPPFIRINVEPSIMTNLKVSKILIYERRAHNLKHKLKIQSKYGKVYLFNLLLKNKRKISNHIIPSKVEQIQIKTDSSFLWSAISWGCFETGHCFPKNVECWNSCYLFLYNIENCGGTGGGDKIKKDGDIQPDEETQMTAYGFLNKCNFSLRHYDQHDYLMSNKQLCDVLLSLDSKRNFNLTLNSLT